MKNILIISFLLLVGGYGFGQEAKSSINNISTDSLRISIYDILKNPVIRVNNEEFKEIISYSFGLTINGVYHNWNKLKSDTLSQNITSKLDEVNDSMPLYNQLFIEKLKYLTTSGEIKTAKNLYLWLAKESDCDGVFDIETESYKRSTKNKFYYCDNIIYKVINYRRDGSLYGTLDYQYGLDTITIKKLYREDGSIAILERKTNGLDDGEYFIYYPDGTKKLEAINNMGIRISEKIYDVNGNLTSESQCDNDGKNCTLKQFDSNGKMINEQPFKYKGTKYKNEK